MSEYVVKVGFWLLAYDSCSVEASYDAEAIEQAKTAARGIMERSAHPEHIELEDRRGGVIAYIDRVTPEGRSPVIENLDFGDPPLGLSLIRGGGRHG